MGGQSISCHSGLPPTYKVSDGQAEPESRKEQQTEISFSVSVWILNPSYALLRMGKQVQDDKEEAGTLLSTLYPLHCVDWPVGIFVPFVRNTVLVRIN